MSERDECGLRTGVLFSLIIIFLLLINKCRLLLSILSVSQHRRTTSRPPIDDGPSSVHTFPLLLLMSVSLPVFGDFGRIIGLCMGVCVCAGGFEQQRVVPQWLSTLLAEKFFKPCSVHEFARKNERNIFCLDCSSSFCPQCISPHRPHRLLQIRRYVYQDVIRLDDLEKLIDCALVQVRRPRHSSHHLQYLNYKYLFHILNPPSAFTSSLT